jgi:catechol 2,3-dioxygenase-like lactoylglutathione lyase family enzyme
MIRPRGIDHVVLRVADLERMLDFYCQVLGCRIERRVDDLGLVQLRAGSALIDLVAATVPVGVRNLDHLCLRIEAFDGDALRAHLTRCGVATEGVVSRYGAEGEGPSVYLADPEGNTIELKGPSRRDSAAARPPELRRTTIVVRDIDRSRRFYRDVLGFRVWFDREYRFSGGGFPHTRAGDLCHLLIMEARDPQIGKIGLLQYTDPPLPPAPLPEMIGFGNVVLVGEVDDVHGLYARLQAAAVPVQTPPHLFEVVGADGRTKRMWRCCFFDPDRVFFELSSPPLE